jgi:biotin carboxyl carrier protein
VSFHGVLRGEGREHLLLVTLRDGTLRGTADGSPVPDTAVERRDGLLLLARGREAARAVVARDGSRVLVHLHGRVHEFEIADGSAPAREKSGRRLHAGDEPWIGSPMTGTVVRVAVAPGDRVPSGGTLAVVEAMKMQFVVRAPRDVVVKAVPVKAGQPVDIGAVLAEFEGEPTA